MAALTGDKYIRLVTALLLAFALATVAFAVPARAADDSNSGQLTPAPTLSPQQLSSVLSALGQGGNDTQFQNLLSQFQSQVSSGNYSGAAPTLGQLQGLSSSQQGASSQSLNALLQALSVGSNGASVNSSKLSSLLTPGSGGTAESQQRLSVDMRALANLLQYANSTLASQLLQNSSLLSQAAFQGANGVSLGAAPVSLPKVSGFPGFGVPSVGAPSLSVGTPSGGLPTIPPIAFLIPLLVTGAAATLLLSRRRLVRLVGPQSVPGMVPQASSVEGAEAIRPPPDPRGRIEFYFQKAVRLMARRGVRKLDHETHREFSVKCEPTPQAQHVGTISSLYERAKFSGQVVGGQEADLAARSLHAMDKEER